MAFRKTISMSELREKPAAKAEKARTYQGSKGGWYAPNQAQDSNGKGRKGGKK
ncbi:hypothetical protein ACIPW9_37010 [Streptomyces sp. NPDC090052]|uniref:hypothetical protein n=1 Tax=Streptomyces sp. NPDC090052 TaxID=3365931 RepID=UPI00381CCE32